MLRENGVPGAGIEPGTLDFNATRARKLIINLHTPQEEMLD